MCFLCLARRKGTTCWRLTYTTTRSLPTWAGRGSTCRATEGAPALCTTAAPCRTSPTWWKTRVNCASTASWRRALTPPGTAPFRQSPSAWTATTRTSWAPPTLSGRTARAAAVPTSPFSQTTLVPTSPSPTPVVCPCACPCPAAPSTCTWTCSGLPLPRPCRTGTWPCTGRTSPASSTTRAETQSPLRGAGATPRLRRAAQGGVRSRWESVEEQRARLVPTLKSLSALPRHQTKKKAQSALPAPTATPRLNSSKQPARVMIWSTATTSPKLRASR
mmetsp:Transcript_42469/g.83676  ORF Transcript_42469/g.83676 Transcript_42469/m.83676 type:complete len:275 (+) Transcript_42469:287-1111(+)